MAERSGVKQRIIRFLQPDTAARDVTRASMLKLLFFQTVGNVITIFICFVLVLLCLKTFFPTINNFPFDLVYLPALLVVGIVTIFLLRKTLSFVKSNYVAMTNNNWTLLTSFASIVISIAFITGWLILLHIDLGPGRLIGQPELANVNKIEMFITDNRTNLPNKTFTDPKTVQAFVSFAKNHADGWDDWVPGDLTYRYTINYYVNGSNVWYYTVASGAITHNEFVIYMSQDEENQLTQLVG